MPLPEFYRENLIRNGYKYSFDDAETLNYRKYFCPACQSSDRDRLYALFITRYLDENKISIFKMLEIAPSKSLSEFVRRTGRIKLRTADLLMDAVDDRIDITDMQCYVDNSFDCFICSHVLEHVPDDNMAIRELFRILKPGGWGILMVPIVTSLDVIDEDPLLEDVGERWRRFGQDDHIRMYSKQGFLDRVKSAGFEVKQLGADYFGNDSFARNAISEQSVLYVVGKHE